MSTAPPLSLGVKLSFGVGQIAEGIKTCAFGAFLLFYYNAVLGLSADLAGLSIGLALIIDALTDPIAGSVSDRWHSPMGRRHPFMYTSALPLGFSFFLLFNPLVALEEVGQSGLFAWMFLSTVLTRLSMTLYTVPHQALGAELSEDYDERTVLVAIRHTFGATGYLIVYLLGFGWFFAPTPEFENGQTNPAAYPPFALVLGLIITLSVLITAYGTRSRVPYMPQASADEKRVRMTDVLKETLQAMRNESFRWVMFGFILLIVAFGMAGVLGLYVYTYFWELTRFQILLTLIFGPIGSFLGYMVAKPFFVWLDKRDAMIAGGIAWMVVHAIPIGLYFLGWIPPAGSWALTWLLVGFGILGGMSIAQIVVGIGTAMADIADENELHTGRRQEGVFFGASSFANKCSAALGSVLAGQILTWIGWPVGQVIKSADDLPREMVIELAVAWGPIASLLAIPGLLCLRGYKLNRRNVAEIKAALRTV